jgi:sigma-B regulation protein RsbU (phosphoserine phosphatase)
LDLEKRIREDMFITLFLAIIDTQTNTATYARAGHEPALLAKQGEGDEITIDKLHGNGMALGMVPADFFDETIEDKVVPFEEGNVMVLFTDGVTEAENEEREEFGQDRLSDKLSSRVLLKPNEFNRKLLADLDEYSSVTHERDDVTIVTLKRV